MAHRVPGAATAARYSQSPVYAFNTRLREPPAPFDNWQDAIRHELSKWPEVAAAKLASRIEQEIAQHRKKTNSIDEEIPGYSDSGLSWSFLYTIAVRGDFKRRRTVKYADLPGEGEQEDLTIADLGDEGRY
jgi:predicted phosphoadenosine phosphosulfate sulfurtransferase